MIIDPARELRTRAELLHHAVSAKQPDAVARLRVLPELRKASPSDLDTFATEIQRKHCLAVVARELGFHNWQSALDLIEGRDSPNGFGEMLAPKRLATHLNQWFVHYPEARDHRSAHGGYLLAYRQHFLVVERSYIDDLGLDPDDADWAAIGHDWARPRQVNARARLIAKLMTADNARSSAARPTSPGAQ